MGFLAVNLKYIFSSNLIYLFLFVIRCEVLNSSFACPAWWKLQKHQRESTGRDWRSGGTSWTSSPSSALDLSHQAAEPLKGFRSSPGAGSSGANGRPGLGLSELWGRPTWTAERPLRTLVCSALVCNGRHDVLMDWFTIRTNKRCLGLMFPVKVSALPVWINVSSRVSGFNGIF